MAEDTYILDPWLEREADRIVAERLDGPNPPPEYAALSKGQQAVYREQFLNALYKDAGLNDYCRNQRVGYLTLLIAKCHPLLPLIPEDKVENIKNANGVVGTKPEERDVDDLLIDIISATSLYNYLRKLEAQSPTKVEVQEKVEVVADASRTEFQGFVSRAARRDGTDEAEYIGQRIRRYEKALADGTPESLTLAQNLWREMRGSLAGWLVGTETLGDDKSAVDFIKDNQGSGGKGISADLRAFADRGYSPVVKGETEVNSNWYGQMPSLIKDWRPDWALAPLPTTQKEAPLVSSTPGAGYSPAEVAQWLYDARVGQLELQTFLDVYPPKDRQAVAYQVFQSTSPSAWALDSSSKSKPQFDYMVQGRDFFTGALSQRFKRINSAYNAYNTEQKRLDEEGVPQDPLVTIKLPAVHRAKDFLAKKAQSEGDDWGAVSRKTSPRDPWIPLNVLSAFVSYKCQFPWGDWGQFFVHPNGVSVENAGWYYTMDDSAKVEWDEYDEGQTASQVRKGILKSKAGKDPNTGKQREGGEVAYNHYDPMVSPKLGAKTAKVRWSDPHTLSGINNFSPWRLTVIQLGPKAEYAYRTYDWFQHPLQDGETVADIVEAYRLPYEVKSVFISTLKAENADKNMDSFFDGTASAVELSSWVQRNFTLAVPRIIPMYFLLREGDATSIPFKTTWKGGRPVYGMDPTLVGTNTGMHFYSKDGVSGNLLEVRKLRQGISPISRLFLFYLNNDYRVFSQRLASLLFSTKTLYKALTGDNWPSGEGISPSHTCFPGTEFRPNPKYIGEDSDRVYHEDNAAALDRYRTLYRKSWSASKYVNIGREVPADVSQQAEADTTTYEGFVNPAFIPQTGAVKDAVFRSSGGSPEEYHISQGFVARVTRRTGKCAGRLSTIERGLNIPQPDSRLVLLGKELKRSFQQQRIALFTDLVEKTFISWLEEEGPIGALRNPYKKSITDAYNVAWSGFFTPDRVPEEKATLGKFAPAHKYITGQRFGLRRDIAPNPETGKPYEYSVSDLVARWSPAAVRREGSPAKNKSLYPYQSNAVLKLLDNNGGLLAFDVGVGKTIAALAAVGMLKQQGKATRAVFLVPKSIKLKWWKDMQESLPDWRVAVFGRRIDFPTKKAELSPERQKEYHRIYKAILATRFPKTASGEKKKKALRVKAEEIALNVMVGVWGNLKQVLTKVYNGRVPKDVLKRLTKHIGDYALTLSFPPMEPTWVEESPKDTLTKLEHFRDGYYDCLLLDEYDFKRIAIQRGKALGHFVNASPMFAYLYRNGFSTGRNALNKPVQGVNKRLGMALKYLGTSAKESPFTPGFYLTLTNNGASNTLWPWCPILSGDSFPYYPSVRAYIEETISELSGREDAQVWRDISDLFFQRNLTLERTKRDLDVEEYYRTILGASDTKANNVAAGAFIVYDKPKTAEDKKLDAVYKALNSEDALELGTIDVLNTDIAVFMGATNFHYAYQEFYKNLEITTNPGRYPDGAVIQDYFNFGVISYDSTLPGGHEVIEPLQVGRTPLFQEPIQTNTATDIAQIVVDTINLDPGKYDLSGPVKVQEEKKAYPSPISGKLITNVESREAYAAKFSKLIKPYLAQNGDPYQEPTLTWEDLKVDSFIIDEAHRFKGLFEPGSRGGNVAYLGSGGTSTQAWLMEYMTHTVKRRGGQIMLLTATPAKQSPVDFYNIVQLLGSRGIGKNQNLYNLFNINTAEQFISRFVCIQERVIVNQDYEARVGPAATMFGPFDNLLTEFTQIFKRYSDRKTIGDAPYLRGDTVATTLRKEYSEAQRALNLPLWKFGTWEAGENELTTYGPSLVDAFALEDPDYDEESGISGLPRARLRVTKGDDTGDFRVLNYTSEPTDKPGEFRNVVTVLPAFVGDAGGTAEARPWSIFVRTKVPVPIVLKPVVNMLPSQAALYHDYQRALGAMLTAGTNVSSVKVKIGDREGVKVLRKEIFTTLSRLALHPELQSYSSAFIIDEGEDAGEIGEEDEAEVEEDEDPILTQKKIVASSGQSFTDGLVMSYLPRVDPQVLDKKDPLYKGDEIRQQQAFSGSSKKRAQEPGDLGWRGKVQIINPEFRALRELYKDLHEDLSAVKADAAEEARNQGKDEDAIAEAVKDATTEWCSETLELGVKLTVLDPEPGKKRRKKVYEQEEGTQGSVYANVEAALDASSKKGDRQKEVVKVWNEETDKPFAPTAVNPVRTISSSAAFKGGVRSTELHQLRPIASRTLALSDTIVGQALYDITNPYMGNVTCGNIVFVNNVLYQAMQLVTLCRVNALVKAAQYELEVYKKYLGKQGTPDAKELMNILNWYGLGLGKAPPVSQEEDAPSEPRTTWCMPFVCRGLLNLTFPSANIANLHTGNTDPGDPNDPTIGDTCREIRLVLRAIHQQSFGSQGGTYANGDPNTAPVAFTGARYEDAAAKPACWYWLVGQQSEPSRWTRYDVDSDEIEDAYYTAWTNQGHRVCIMNAASAPSDVREELAQLFNGEYETITDEEGNTTYKAVRPPTFDLVIANSVAYEGIDLQTRTCRIIHADLPFTPSDLIQRNGRAVRQGNLYEETEIQAVLAMDTVDYYRIQAIERKRGWLDSALDEGKASYELSNNERELLELATKAVLPSQREQVEDKVRARLEAIEAEERERAFSPVLNQLTIAASKQRTININNAASPEVYKNSIFANQNAKKVSLRMAEKPTGGCG